LLLLLAPTSCTGLEVEGLLLHQQHGLLESIP
jgi:hypothetical protein